VYESPNLIARIHRQETPIIPLFKSHSCPAIIKYLEELDFDEKFELSLFKTQSESALDSLVPNPDFAAALEVEKHNKLIENFILRHLQSDIQAANLVDFLEAASANIGFDVTASASKTPTKPPFIRTIPLQPIITYSEFAANSPPSSHIASPLHTPPHTPHTSAPPTPPTTPRPNLPRAMAARFAPLALPQNLHDMPANYQSKIPTFDGTPQSVFAQQHIYKMANFCDLYEIDEEDVTMRLFVQTFGGEVRKWFRGLTARSIPTLDELQRQFLDRWEIRKDPLQINAEYNNLKRNHGESIQDYIIRFNTVYNAIPDDLRPSRKSALLKFPDGFDPEMAYSLRDRDPPTLEDMQKIAVSVEANLNDKRARMKAEKRVIIKEEDSTSDQILRKVERMLEKVTLDKPELQIRNPNFLVRNNHNT